MRDLTRRMAKGAAWMVLARVVDRSVAFISTIILARLLVPSDFGLVSLATAILAGLELLGAFSFDLALIQNQSADRSHYDTVWTIGLIFAAFFATAMVALSYPAAHFFNEPRLSAVMQFLALGVLGGGLSNIGVVAFRKELQFERELKFLVSKRLVLFAVTVSLAYVWRDYWALAVGTVTGMMVGVLISYRMHPYRPRFSLAKRKELFGFSQWLFINNTLGFLYNKIADFIVAKSIDTTALGYYGVAYEISNLPSTELVMPVNRAVFPGYSRMSTDVQVLRQGYLNVISMIALLAIPAAVGVGCVAAPLVNAFLGPKWISAIPLIPALAIHGLLTALMSCGNYTFIALGRPRQVTVAMTAYICIAVPLLTVGALRWGIEGVAWGALLAAVLLAPVNYVLLSRTLGVRVADLASVLWRPVTSTVAMVGVLAWVQAKAGVEFGALGHLRTLLLLVATGAVTYGVSVLALWQLARRPDGAERFIIGQVARRLGRSL